MFNIVNRMMIAASNLLQDKDSFTFTAQKNTCSFKDGVKINYSEIDTKAFTKSLNH